MDCPGGMMKHLFKDREHLVRLALLFVAAATLFLGVRALFVPKGFGARGHYRAGALEDVAGRPPHFAGRQACLDCHQDMADSLATGNHRGVGCEACHGALAKHVEDPTGSPAVKPDTKLLCPVCHAAESARPKTFPQVNVKEHAADAACKDCHAPHHPNL